MEKDSYLELIKEVEKLNELKKEQENNYKKMKQFSVERDILKEKYRAYFNELKELRENHGVDELNNAIFKLSIKTNTPTKEVFSSLCLRFFESYSKKDPNDGG